MGLDRGIDALHLGIRPGIAVRDHHEAAERIHNIGVVVDTEVWLDFDARSLPLLQVVKQRFAEAGSDVRLKAVAFDDLSPNGVARTYPRPAKDAVALLHPSV